MKKSIHYGWFICFGCFLMIFCTMGIGVNVFSVFLPYVIEVNSLTKVQGSSIIMVENFTSLVAMLLAGKYFNRLGLRFGSTLAIFSVLIAYIIYANSHSAISFCIGAAFVGFGYGAGTMIPASILINNWFTNKKAFALGFAASGSGIATVVMPNIVTSLLEQYGINLAFYFTAACILVITIINIVIIRDNPSDKMLSLYVEKNINKSYVAEFKDKKAASSRQNLSNGHFVLAFMTILLFGAVVLPANSHLAVHFSTLGYSAILVSTVISLYGLFLTVGKFFYGFVTDKIGGLKSTLIFNIVLMLGFLTTYFAGVHIAMLFTCAVIIGLSFAVGSMATSIWAMDLFSPNRYPTVIRYFQIAFVLGGTIGSILPGIIAEKTGTYSLTFLIYIVILAFVLISIKYLYKCTTNKVE